MSKKESANASIEEYLNYYVNLENPKYAILIKGDWGSGKTFFLKNYIGNSTLKEKSIYVSLYGLTNTKSIESEIFKQMYPILGSDMLKKTGFIAKQAIKGHLKIDLDGSEGSLDISLPSAKLENLLNKKREKNIFIFDDLERTGIPYEELLGYINQMVEHNAIKVILIADENKIKNATTNNPNLSYLNIKEKLIGQDFSLKLDFSNALSHFVKELKNDKVKNLISITTKNGTLSQSFNDSKVNNLRLLRQSLIAYERLFITLDNKDLVSNIELQSELFAAFMCLFFLIKSGKIEKEELNTLTGNRFLNLFDSSTKSTPREKELNKIKNENNFASKGFDLLTTELWSNLIFDGLINVKEINLKLSNSRFFVNQNSPDYVKLFYWNDYKDTEIEELIESVVQSWNNKDYKEVNLVILVTSIFMFFSIHKIYNKEISEIVSNCLEYISYINSEKPIQKIKSSFPRETYNSLGFYCRDRQELQDIIKHVEELADHNKIEEYKMESKTLLEKMSNNVMEFYHNIILSNSSDNIEFNIPIFQYIDKSLFIQKIIELTHSQRMTVGDALKNRYQYEQFRNELILEKTWLDDILGELENVTNNSALLKITNFSLTIFGEKIKEARKYFPD